jgi:DMSO/TMAO reductase YedYZ heme-binding membrane subunit
MNLPTPSSALTNLVPVTSQASRHTRERNQFETVTLVVYLAVTLFRKTFETPVVISILSLVGTLAVELAKTHAVAYAVTHIGTTATSLARKLAEALGKTLPVRCANSKTCSRLSKRRTLSGNPRTYGK